MYINYIWMEWLGLILWFCFIKYNKFIQEKFVIKILSYKGKVIQKYFYVCCLWMEWKLVCT